MINWLIGFAAFALGAWLTVGLNAVSLRAWRRSAGQHWTERARLLYPVRASAGQYSVLISVNLTLLAVIGQCPTPWYVVLYLAYFGTMLGRYPLAKAIFPEWTFRGWLRQTAVQTLVASGYWIVLVLGVLFMPDTFGWGTWLTALPVLAALVAWSCGYGVYLRHWLGVIKPASSRLQAIVAEVSARMAVPVRAVWEISGPNSNALALPIIGHLIFSEKLLALAPEEEIKAVCAHELGHLSESRWVLLQRLSGVLRLFPVVFIKPFYHQLGLDKLPYVIMVYLVVFVLVIRGLRKLGRNMEKRADNLAVKNTPAPTVSTDHSAPLLLEPPALNLPPVLDTLGAAIYARALTRLYEANQMPAVMPVRAKQIHPDLYDRIIAAGIIPDFPRPAPPERRTAQSKWMGRFYPVLLLLTVLVCAYHSGQDLATYLRAQINLFVPSSWFVTRNHLQP